MDITDWYWFEKVFNDKELELIDKVKDKYKEENASTFGASEDYRKSNIRWLPFDDTTEWIYRRLVDCMEEANMITYNFDWDGITENIQYTEYDAEYEGHYDYHIDVGGDRQNRKISAVVMLNDGYEGGELELYGKDISYALGKGNVIIFPSFMLHKVHPVTKGLRKSLVVWGISEKPFK